MQGKPRRMQPPLLPPTHTHTHIHFHMRSVLWSACAHTRTALTLFSAAPIRVASGGIERERVTRGGTILRSRLACCFHPHFQTTVLFAVVVGALSRHGRRGDSCKMGPPPEVCRGREREETRLDPCLRAPCFLSPLSLYTHTHASACGHRSEARSLRGGGTKATPRP